MRRAVLLVGLIVVVGAGVVVLVNRNSDNPPKHAVVNTVIRSPRVAVFYGRSCQGVHGDWFLNIVQGGSNEAVRSAYYLKWSFAGRAVTAKPDGRVTITGGTSTSLPTATLKGGVVTLSGMAADGSTVSATGSLSVRLTESSTSPEVTITETGLSDAVKSLGVQSPFPSDTTPLRVPVELETKVSGC